MIVKKLLVLAGERMIRDRVVVRARLNLKTALILVGMLAQHREFIYVVSGSRLTSQFGIRDAARRGHSPVFLTITAVVSI
jgi:hypothetical protein